MPAASKVRRRIYWSSNDHHVSVSQISNGIWSKLVDVLLIFEHGPRTVSRDAVRVPVSGWVTRLRLEDA